MTTFSPASVFSRWANTDYAIVILAACALPCYGLLAISGDLRERPVRLLVVYGLLVLLMMTAWLAARGRSHRRRYILAAALAFRLIAAWGEPALSDDVYRYVWDGRVQLEGFHPYRHAPLDPELNALRDEGWSRINHPELKTIYPPLSEMLFLALRGLGAGVVGFKVAFGLIDFALVLALGYLLRRLNQPAERLILYAWNPLAILESAGSGHVEPFGALMLVLAGLWILAGHGRLSALALAAAIQIKILPILLAPLWFRRIGLAGALLLMLAVGAFSAPYALSGPPLGAGLFDYAQRWERNAVVYPLVHGVLERLELADWLKRGIVSAQERWGGEGAFWDRLHRHVWPQSTARMLMATAALAWLIHVVRRWSGEPVRAALWILGGALLLSPTLHPWYLLWVLPLAAAYGSWGWLTLAMLIPLSYAYGAVDVPWWVRSVEYLPPLAVALWLRTRSAAGRRVDAQNPV